MKRLELLVEKGEIAGRRFAVPPAGLRLGRASSNDVHVPDEELSRTHCLFEPDGETGLRVTDLASANGTFVNGKALGPDAKTLIAGDLVEAGALAIRVVGDDPAPKAETPRTDEAPAAVDLGLGAANRIVGMKAPKLAPKASGGGLRRLVLWTFALLVMAGACAAYLYRVRFEEAPKPIASVATEGAELLALEYEKVDANAEGIFRYQMTLAADGTLAVTIDDVPKENRHVAKSHKLGAAAAARLKEILFDRDLASVDDETVGPDPGGTLASRVLRIVRTDGVRTVRVVNAPEPDAFRTVREKLETFVQNELGVWAIQYSRDKLLELAATSAASAQAKWDDRDVEYGNLHASVCAWREALFYLETVNPKPAAYAGYAEGLRRAQDELDKRYREQRFRADRAINMADWETAKSELAILCDLVPDRDDDRHREAKAKLVDVEKRLTTKGGR